MKKLNARIVGVTAMVALICLLIARQAMAFNQDHLDRLLEKKECSRCDLDEVNLSGADLSGAYLSEANLSRAELSKAHLWYADLSGAAWIDGRRCAQGSSGACK